MAKVEKLKEVVKHVKPALAQTEEKALTLSAEAQAAMMGDMEQGDLTIPRLVVLEGLSPEVTKGKLGFPGDLFMTVLNKNFGGGPVEVIPLFRYKSRIRFDNVSDGGGMLCRAQDGKHGVGDPGGDCVVCPMKEFQGQEKPLCTEFQNVVCLMRGQEEHLPVILSGSKTRLKAFKSWNSLLLANTQATPAFPQGRPMFAKSYLVKPTAISNAAKQESHSFEITVANNNAMLPTAEQQAASEWFHQLIGKRFDVAPEHNEEVNPKEKVAY